MQLAPDPYLHPLHPFSYPYQVQFAVGLVAINTSMLGVSYGVGDCLSASRHVATADVAAMLAGDLELDVL